MKKSLHAVQFYEDEESGMEMTAQFLAPALVRKDAVIIIATSTHRRIIEKQLVEFGLDAKQAAAEGWYVALDASKTLSSFMEGDRLLKDRFEEIIGTVIKNAAAKSSSGKVHAYGEMVALLCERNMPEKAIELEIVWNDLGRQLEFSLFCAYPLETIMHLTNSSVSHICAAHSSTVRARVDLPPIETK
jgi:hypothetical protein